VPALLLLLTLASDDTATFLASAQEAVVRKGVELAVQQNSVKSVGLLLDVLNLEGARGLAAAHYRDMAWDGLSRIKDFYARQRVEKELQESRRPFVRQWCAELLGVYGAGEFGPTLLKALGDSDLGVRRAAARSLGALRHAPASAALGPLAGEPDPVLRANAIEALARIDAEANAAPFLAALRVDEDGGVRCALLAAAPALYPQLHEDLARASLADTDWRPRAQAVENLGATKTKSAVDTLIEALADTRPAVAGRAAAALRALTGKEILDAKSWASWWRAAREKFEFAEGAAPAAPPESKERKSVSYHGIAVSSDHVAFLFDKSFRMSEKLKEGKETKERAAREELERVLTKLRGDLRFHLFAYAQEVTPFRKRASDLDAKEQKQALKFLDKIALKGSKDIWLALETVLDDPEIDTAFLLSSGEPDIGLYVHWNRVTDHLRDRNRFRKLVVHTVVYSDSKWFRDQLQKISEATGGEHRAFE